MHRCFFPPDCVRLDYRIALEKEDFPVGADIVFDPEGGFRIVTQPDPRAAATPTAQRSADAAPPVPSRRTPRARLGVHGSSKESTKTSSRSRRRRDDRNLVGSKQRPGC
jgi:hypothetical protein